MLLVALFASIRVSQWRQAQVDEAAQSAFRFLGMPVQYSSIVGAVVFVLLAFVIFMLTYGLATGIRGLDSKTHGLIDLLIDTESELAKVSWPGSDELTRSTTAVLISIALLALFLFLVDWFVASVMRSLGVLP